MEYTQTQKYMLTEIPIWLTKKSYNPLGIMSYLGNFSLATVEVCEPLRKPHVIETQVNMEQHIPPPIWQSKSNNKKQAAMAFYNKKRTAGSRKRCIGYGSQSKFSASEGWDAVPKKCTTQQCCTLGNCMCKQKHEKPLGIQQGLDKWHHYCFTHKVSVIIEHKSLVANFKKDLASLLERLHRILLGINQ